MLTWIKRVVAAPVFEGDEDKTRNAFFLNTFLWALCAISVIAVPAIVVSSENPAEMLLSIVTALPLPLVFLVLIRLLRRGRVHLTAMVLNTLIWLAVTAAIAVFGVRSTVIGGYLLAIFLAGLLLGARATILFTALSALAVFGVFLAERRFEPNLLPILPTRARADVGDLAILLATSGITAVLVGLAQRRIRRALQEARENERTLAEVNRELDANRDALQVRTQDLQRQSRLLHAAATVSRDETAVRELDALVNRAAHSIQERFGTSYVGIFLVKDNPAAPGEDTQALADEVDEVEELEILDPDSSETAEEKPDTVDAGDTAQAERGAAGLSDKDEAATADAASTGGETESADSNNPTQDKDAEEQGLDNDDASRRYAMLCASAGKVDRREPEQEPVVEIGDQSLVGRAISRGWHQVTIATGADAVAPEGPVSPVVHSEIALPLRVGQRVTGALHMQNQKEGAFSSTDATVLQAMADQLAVAIENVNLLEELRDTVQQLETASRHYTEESWQAVGRRTDRPHGYRYRDLAIEPLNEQPAASRQAWLQGHPVMITTPEDDGRPGASTIAVPVTLRGQIVGVLNLSFGGKPPTADTVSLIKEVANRLALALENVRLLEEARQRAARDHVVADITTRVRSSVDVENILHTVVRQLGAALGADRTFVELGLSTRPPEA